MLRSIAPTTANAGTVTSVSVTTANGVSGVVATATSTPAIALTLGAITPTSVNGSTTPPNTGVLGYLNVPSNPQSAAYTAVAGDSGYSIDHPVGDNNARTITIPSNASVTYALGTCISFSNMAAAALTIAITSDTLNLAGAGSTGSRTLAQYGVAVARKITSTGWLISGTNLT